MSDLTSSPKFPGSPDLVAYPGLFEWPISGDLHAAPPGDIRENYGVQLVGYFHPKVTAAHSFYLSADDQLYLSSDEDPANKILIASEPVWNGPRNYTGADRRPVVDEGTGRRVNQSAPVELVAGRRYYIEALMKEGIFGEDLSVAVVVGGSSIPAHPINGTQLSSFSGLPTPEPGSAPAYAAYEGFGYPGGADLSGKDGGVGWHAPWGVRVGEAVVPGDAVGDSGRSGSLTYTDSSGSILVTSGNRVERIAVLAVRSAGSRPRAARAATPRRARTPRSAANSSNDNQIVHVRTYAL